MDGEWFEPKGRPEMAFFVSGSDVYIPARLFGSDANLLVMMAAHDGESIITGKSVGPCLKADWIKENAGISDQQRLNLDSAVASILETVMLPEAK